MPAKKTRDVQSRRRFSAREIQSHWQSLDEAFRIQQQATRAKVEAVKGDIVAFFREICCELRKDGGIGYSHPKRHPRRRLLERTASDICICRNGT